MVEGRDDDGELRRRSTVLLLWWWFLCSAAVCSCSSSAAATEAPRIIASLGVNYGTMGDNLPSAAAAVELLRSTVIRKVKLFTADGAILGALAGTGIEAMVGIGDDEIKPLASGGVAAAKAWIEANIAPYVPATEIGYLSVGNEVISGSDGEMIWELHAAMENLHAACQQNPDLRGVKITTPHSMGLLAASEPPSEGRFADGAAAILGPILGFLARTGSPYVANAYPFFGYLSNPNSSNLAYALFDGSTIRYDPATKLSYDNMFDAQVDAVYAAIARLGFENVTVAVGETGWPSAGDQYEPGVGLENARAFNSRLVRRLASGLGSPLRRPDSPPPLTYLFALFDEDLKPGASSERHWGLFAPDRVPVYDCGIVALDPSSPSPSSSSSPSPSSSSSSSPSSSSSSSSSPSSSPSSSSSSSSPSPSPSSTSPVPSSSSSSSSSSSPSSASPVPSSSSPPPSSSSSSSSSSSVSTVAFSSPSPSAGPPPTAQISPSASAPATWRPHPPLVLLLPLLLPPLLARIA